MTPRDETPIRLRYHAKYKYAYQFARGMGWVFLATAILAAIHHDNNNGTGILIPEPIFAGAVTFLLLAYLHLKPTFEAYIDVFNDRIDINKRGKISSLSFEDIVELRFSSVNFALHRFTIITKQDSPVRVTTNLNGAGYLVQSILNHASINEDMERAMAFQRAAIKQEHSWDRLLQLRFNLLRFAAKYVLLPLSLSTLVLALRDRIQTDRVTSVHVFFLVATAFTGMVCHAIEERLIEKNINRQPLDKTGWISRNMEFERKTHLRMRLVFLFTQFILFFPSVFLPFANKG